MRKRSVAILGTTLAVVGVMALVLGLAQAGLVNADSATSLTEASTIQSFLVFGGSMLGAAVILFILLIAI